MSTNYAPQQATPAEGAAQPLYDIDSSYADNVASGPVFSGQVPDRKWPERSQWVDFLGTPVASRVGVPAGPLLTAEWTTLAGQLGYDIVTYKTIRSTAHPGHPLPNVLFVDHDGQLDSANLPRHLITSKTAPAGPDLAITNSFGMPSQSADFLRVDIPRARAELAPGQVLVVSITGTPSADHSIADDFVKAAELAVECGAPIIEANFSCPNVGAKEGTLYLAPDDAASVAKRIRSVIGHTPLIIKVGVFTDPSVLRQLLDALSHAGTNAVSGINTISMTVNDDTGQPALGTNRPTSGVCGTPIRAASLQFVTAAREAIDRGGLPLTLIGVGGITTPQHIDQVLAAGADFAQTATGMMWNPYLAQQYHSAHTAGA